MPVISFGKTSDRLPHKTVTRRDWKERTVKTFIKAYQNGTEVTALNKSYRNGGKAIAIIELVQEPYWEMLKDMPEIEIIAEGYPELTKEQFIDKFFDKIETKMLCVVRFKVIKFLIKP